MCLNGNRKPSEEGRQCTVCGGGIEEEEEGELGKEQSK